VLPEHPALHPWFRPEGVRELIGRCREVPKGSAMLWAIVQFAIWHHFLRQGFSERPPALKDPVALLEDKGDWES